MTQKHTPVTWAWTPRCINLEHKCSDLEHVNKWDDLEIVGEGGRVGEKTPPCKFTKERRGRSQELAWKKQ